MPLHDTDASCACLHVNYFTKESSAGTVTSSWWACQDCGRKFTPVSSVKLTNEALVEAEQKVLDLSAALEAVRPVYREQGCWCAVGRDVELEGHSRCEQARAALGGRKGQ